MCWARDPMSLGSVAIFGRVHSRFYLLSGGLPVDGSLCISGQRW